MISIKNLDQLAKMRSAGHLLYDVLCAAREFIRPDITTMDLNAFVDGRPTAALPRLWARSAKKNSA